MFSFLARLTLRLFGWKVVKVLPEEKKYLVIGAPHTSNWDFPLGLLALGAMNLKLCWVGKHTLFKWPFGYFFKALGGIPVDRTVHTGFIHKIAELYRDSDSLTLTMAPEGTRSKTEYWKSGFYHIAMEANIPIALGFLDYPNKTLGIGKYFTPTGDTEKDMQVIVEFYSPIKGKYPEKQGPIILHKS